MPDSWGAGAHRTLSGARNAAVELWGRNQLPRMGLHGSFDFAQDDAERFRIGGSRSTTYGNELQERDTRLTAIMTQTGRDLVHDLVYQVDYKRSIR